MNILITSHFFYPSIGGIEVISEILAQHFNDAGHSLILITQSNGSRTEDTKRFAFPILRNPTYRKLIQCYQWADVVFQNNIELRLLWPIFFYRKPLVIGLQTWIRSSSGHRGLVGNIKRLSLACASHVIACSHSIRVDSFYKSIVIGNPYDSDTFRILPIMRSPRSIVFLGRLVSDKGAELLISAFAALNDSTSSLTIIGDGPERLNLESLVVKFGICDNVSFVGELQGIGLATELNKHEIMVVPSLWREPFGIVALEGLACGCVVLASDGGGLADAVGNAGLLFKRGDAADLLSKLQSLLNNASLRSSLRSHALLHLRAFDRQTIANQYLSILESSVKN